MDNSKKLLVGLGAFLLIYIGFTIKPLISYYSSKSYVLINGKKYTESDMESLPVYKKIRKDYANNLGQVFDQFASEEMIRLEAISQNTTPEELLKKAADYKPSEPEILAIFVQYENQLRGKKLDEVRPQIVQFIQGGKQEEFRNKLRDKYKVEPHIDSPEPVRHNVAEKDNPAIGPKGAKVTIIEFSDFECPFCQKSQGVNNALREKYKDQIRWVFRDFPLPFHPNAMAAHVAANCANKQGKYWDYFNSLFQNTGKLTPPAIAQLAKASGLDISSFETCIADKDGKISEEIQTDLKDGSELGVNGTPAFFINGIFVEGAQPIAVFVNTIEQELKK
jgi:protein-disulfide isomerase